VVDGGWWMERYNKSDFMVLGVLPSLQKIIYEAL